MPTPSAFVANHELKPLPFDPANGLQTVVGGIRFYQCLGEGV